MLLSAKRPVCDITCIAWTTEVKSEATNGSNSDSDEEAIAKVRSMKKPFYCELWDAHKQLARIPPHWRD